MSTKQKRFPNFTELERQLLIKVAVHYKSIIECKKTDAVIWREKLECWDKIASKFNAGSTTHFWTAKQLKNKYESIKKEMRKKHSDHNSNCFQY
ncbi:hypothetical protein JTB14_016990 [Gonioctena quinquepunctata]|nr:hypothetical protein JTB14_016990 [Gonioctena quinquepunctata]